MFMTSKTNPQSRKAELVVQELKDELLIYDLKTNQAYCLNQTSALVWQLCDGNNSVLDISRQLSKKFKSKVGEDFVWLAIDQLKKDNLLANGEEIVSDFKGLSRREVIRQVGLASMIALPVIASLTAPTAIMAVSCVAQQGICTSSAQCCASAPNCNAGPFVNNSHCCIGSGSALSGTQEFGSAVNSVANACADARANCCSNSATTTQSSCNGGGCVCNVTCS